MKRKLNPKEKELYKRCDEVLFYVWDPIGISDIPGPRDEYESYVPQVFMLIRNNAPPSEVVEHLDDMAKGLIGLTVNAEKTEATVQLLFRWREFIWSSQSDN